MSEIARGKRFSLLAVTGYPIWPSSPAASSGHRESTSYCIVDRVFSHREVWADYAPKENRPGGQNNRSTARRRNSALAKLDELEAEHG